MATNDSTSTAAIIEKVVSSIVQETLLQESILIPSIQDMSAMIRPGMDRLDIPRFTALPVEAVTEGTGLTANVSTIVTDKLLMDSNEAIHWTVSDRAMIQDKVNISVQIVKDAAKQLAAAIDNKIVDELILASAAAPDHIIAWATPSVIALEDIAEARRLLNIQNVPQTERFMLMPPDQEKNLLAIDNFISVEKYGSREALLNGEIGRIFGFTVLMSTSPSILVTNSMFYHRSAVAYGTQINAKFETDRNIVKLEDEFTLSQLYGVKLLDAGVRQVLFNADGIAP